MSNSLEKLKELTEKLEEKLAEKKTKQSPRHTTKDSDTHPSTSPVSLFEVPQHNDSNFGTFEADTKPQAGKGAIEQLREMNRNVVLRLYRKLGIDEKVPSFDGLFEYKAMNLSGIGLKEEDFAQVREGKYIQIIAITYEPDKYGKKKAKNISLGYFGKAESLDAPLRDDIIEFVLRWRYEKALLNVEHYRMLIEKINRLHT